MKRRLKENVARAFAHPHHLSAGGGVSNLNIARNLARRKYGFGSRKAEKRVEAGQCRRPAA